MRTSIVVPAYNEAKSLPILVKGIIDTLDTNAIDGEIIVVDDGSIDDTGEVAEKLCEKNSRIIVLHHRRNMDKSRALRTGFEKASGDIIVTMDADLQNSPSDIPKLLELLNEDYDMVVGWRKNRCDHLGKRLSSFFFNLLSRKLFGMTIHDFNCGFKAFRRQMLEDIDLRQEEHRYFAAMAHQRGYRVGEIEVQHFPRIYGKSKYGVSRLFSGTLDLISLKLQFLFSEKPIILFAVPGIAMMILGSLFGLYVIALNLLYNEPFSSHLAMLLLSAFTSIGGFQLFTMGFLADMLARFRQEVLDAATEKKAN